MRLGLLPKILLLTLVVFAAAAAAARFLYAPAQERLAEEQMNEVAGEVLDGARSLMEDRDLHAADRNRRELADLPYELTAGDPAKTRALVDAQARESARTSARNVEILTREFRRRTAETTGARANALGKEFRGRALFGLLALLGAVLVLLAGVLAHAVLKPIARLLEATERVADGHLGAAAGLHGADEVGRLGRAFDRMTAALRASRTEVDALNRGLEDKVKEKTEELTRRNVDLTRAIAELGATKDALVHAETMASIGTLAGGVAHEFNNLLGGIIGCAEDARTERDPAAVGEALEMILKTARRACQVTGNLLSFSRPPAREPRPTDLGKLVEEALVLVGPEARAKAVTARAEIAPMDPVRVDPGQIHQVVLNLLTNAIRAMPRGGELTVAARREGPDALIVVRDTGVGIPPDNVKRIFEPFFTTRRESGEGRGTGLGLSVSWSIVKAHGGRIEVESRPGEGSTFTVRLPAAEAS